MSTETVASSPAVTVSPGHGALTPLGIDSVRITGGFWAQRQAVNGTATIEHCRFWLDRLGWTGNFAHRTG